MKMLPRKLKKELARFQRDDTHRASPRLARWFRSIVREMAANDPERAAEIKAATEIEDADDIAAATAALAEGGPNRSWEDVKADLNL